MSAPNTTFRLLTVLFILAGILLLKPVFGQTTTAAPVAPSINRVCYDPIASKHYRDYIAGDVR